MTTIRQFDNPIYPSTLLVVIFDSWEELVKNKRLNTLFPGQLEGDEHDSDCACFVYNKRNGAICLPRRRLSHSTVAHETAHAAIHVLDYVGMPVTMDSSEAFCYLLGWMTDCVYATLRKEGVRLLLKDDNTRAPGT
jgi:hypothetical protein